MYKNETIITCTLCVPTFASTHQKKCEFAISYPETKNETLITCTHCVPTFASTCSSTSKNVNSQFPTWRSYHTHTDLGGTHIECAHHPHPVLMWAWYECQLMIYWHSCSPQQQRGTGRDGCSTSWGPSWCWEERQADIHVDWASQSCVSVSTDSTS